MHVDTKRITVHLAALQPVPAAIDRILHITCATKYAKNAKAKTTH